MPGGCEIALALWLHNRSMLRQPMAPLTHRLGRLDAHHRLGLSLAAAAVAAMVVRGASFPLATMVIWLAYACCNLALCWIVFVRAHPRDLPALSKLGDSSRTLLFVFVLTAALASLGSVLSLLTTLGGLSDRQRYVHMACAVLSILSSWALVHTVFTLRYAHLYYGHGLETSAPRALEFPSEVAPDYLDFAYFSFIIGMTSQTADVNIRCRRLRRLALLHGLLAFVFNVVIVSLTLNVVSGLMGK